MKHLFRATKLGWEKRRKAYGSILKHIPKRRRKRSLSHIKGQHNVAFPILVTNAMVKSIMM